LFDKMSKKDKKAMGRFKKYVKKNFDKGAKDKEEMEKFDQEFENQEKK